MIDDDLDETLLDRYRTGECTSDERARVERWLRDDPSRVALLEWIDTLELAAPRLGGAWDTETLWRTFKSRVGGMDVPPASDDRMGVSSMPSRNAETPVRFSHSARVTARVPSPRWYGYAARAASIAVVLTGAALLWRWNTGSRTNDASMRATQPVMRTYRTEPGQRLSLQLPDGSQVTLAAATRLTVPVTLGDGAHDGTRDVTRDVTLDGQAYFEIAHRTGAPFRVHTADAVTTVLGTRFVIDAYRDDHESSVTVADGRVRVAAVRESVSPRSISRGISTNNAGDTLVTLSSGDRVQLDAARAMTVEHGVDLDRALSWTQGRLEFSNTPLREVIPQLNRWFDLDIHLAIPSLGGKQLTASFKSESASEMLQVIAASLDLRVHRTGRSVVLSPQS